MLRWVHQKYGQGSGPLQARHVQRDIEAHFDVDVSLTTVKKILRLELGMSYKKIYRGNIRTNTVKAKQKRQYAAALFARLLADGKRVIHIDESTLDQTCYVRHGWGTAGEQLHSEHTFRLNRYNIIAATASTGEVWFCVNNGYNTSQTIWSFILKLCLEL